MFIDDGRTKWAKSVADFVVDSCTTSGDYNDDKPLQNQPAAVARVLGNLLDLLLVKGLVTHDEFWAVIEEPWHDGKTIVNDRPERK